MAKSQYKTINGVKYEKDLLDEARKASSGGHMLTTADVERLWKMAMDGNKVTETERKTLKYIMNNLGIDESAKANLKAKLNGCSSKGYYKTMDGISYDRKLLEEGQAMADARGGVLTFEDALHLWGKANDGRGITNTERRTLQFLAGQYRLEKEAKQFWEKSLGLAVKPSFADGLGSLERWGVRFLKALWQRATGQHRTANLQLADVPTPMQLADVPQEPEPKRRRVDSTGSSSRDPASSQLAAAGALPDVTPMPSSYLSSSAEISSTSRACSRSPPHMSSRGELPPTLNAEGSLHPELQQLLETDRGRGPLLQLECPAAATSPVDAELQSQRAKAAAEVERILSARNADELLGQGSREHQKRQFKRILLLLHPDKGLVNHDDKRADLALRLAFAADTSRKRKHDE